jgi:outer membrane protein
MRRLGIVLAVAPVLLAQPQGTVELSLKRAVDIALTPEGSAKVALAQQTIRQAETRVAQARGAFLPNVDGSVQDRDQTTNLKAFGFSFALPVPGFAIPSIVGPYSVFDARASVQQNVLDFTTLSQYKASKSGVASAKADLGVVNDQVSDQVARAYLASLRADAALETARADVELAEALLKLSQQQKDAGTGTGIEVTRAQVQLANNRQQMIVAENGQRRAVLQLLRVMGIQLSAPVHLTGKLEFHPADSPVMDAALTQARSMRTDLKAQKQKEETARLNFGKVRAERLPSLAAFGDYGTIGSEIVGAHPTHTVGITLKVPLYDGGRRDARRQESDSQYRQEQIRTHDLELQIELDVRLAMDSLESTRSQVTVAQEGVGLSENELAQARRRYQAGVTNSVEVTDAQTRLDRARDNLIAALYNHNLARIDLATATGTIGEYVNQ